MTIEERIERLERLMINSISHSAILFDVMGRGESTIDPVTLAKQLREDMGTTAQIAKELEGVKLQ